MAQYWFDANNWPVRDQLPDDFVSVDGSEYTIGPRVVNVTQDNRPMRCLEIRGVAFVRWLYSPSVENAEVCVMAVTTDRRGQGEEPNHNTAALRIQSNVSGYAGGFGNANRDRGIFRYDNGIYEAVELSNLEGDRFANLEMHFQKLRAFGNTLQVKTWRANTAEPLDWQLAGTDSVYSTGKLGLKAKHGTLGSIYIFAVGFGTDGDSAPTGPIDEYRFRYDPYLFSAAEFTGIPTLSAPGVIDITATSARPQVTLTY